MNATMRAMVLIGHGGPDRLVYREDWRKPSPAPGELLVRVRACGLNNTDINTRTAWYSKSVRAGTTGESNPTAQGAGDWSGAGLRFPRIQGGDVCGVVEEAGSAADASLIGKRVLVEPCLWDLETPHDFSKARYLGSDQDGGFAEYVAIRRQAVHPIESDLSDAELATFPIAYQTAENMLTRAHAHEDDIVLIPGASGGVGSALVQLAKRRGARVVAVCSADKKRKITALGADAVFSREEMADDPAAALQTAIGRATISLVADVVGGDCFPQWIECLAPGGRYTCAGAIAGPIVSLDLRTFYLHDLTFTGATISPPDVFPRLVKYIESGEIRPLLAQTYPLEQLHKAQEAFLAKRHVGNIVVTM